MGPDFQPKIVTFRNRHEIPAGFAKICEEPVTLVPRGTTAYFEPGDGSPRVPLGEIESVEFEPEPLRPGDSVNVWPVSAPDGVRGYIVARTAAYPDGMSEVTPETDPLAPADDPVARTWVLDDGSSTSVGPVERALREDLRLQSATAGFSRTLIASAAALAQAMDRAMPDKIASIGREFREHMRKLEEMAGDDDDTSRHSSDLSTPV